MAIGLLGVALPALYTNQHLLEGATVFRCALKYDYKSGRPPSLSSTFSLLLSQLYLFAALLFNMFGASSLSRLCRRG